MGQKKDRKKHEKTVRGLVAAAEDAAQRAEKAAKQARKERKRLQEATGPAQTASTGAAPEPAGTEPAGSQRATPPTTELESATKADLLTMAREAGIAGRSGMTKDELVAALGR